MYQALYGTSEVVDDKTSSKMMNREDPPGAIVGMGGLDSMDPLLEGYEEHELLRSPRDRFRAYRRMAKGNSTLYTAKSHVRNQLLTLSARVERTEGTREDIAVFLEEQFGLGQFSAPQGDQSIEDIVKSAYLAYLYGFGIWEMEARVDGSRAWLKKLHYRQPDTIDTWVLNGAGEWVAVVQSVGGDTALLERRNCFYLVMDPDEGGLLGVGIYRPVYSNWRDAQDAHREVAVAMQRFASPTPQATFDIDIAAKYGLTKPEQFREERKNMATMLMRYQSHEEAWLIPPPWWKLTEFGGKASFEPSKILAVASHHERLIGEAFFAAHLQLGRQGGGGTYNLGKMQDDVSLLAIVNLAEWVFDGINDQIVTSIVEWNFGKVSAEQMPRVVPTGLKTEAYLAGADSLVKLTAAGFVIPDPEIDGPIIRATFGLQESSQTLDTERSSDEG